jgi:hypothetical protein
MYTRMQDLFRYFFLKKKIMTSFWFLRISIDNHVGCLQFLSGRSIWLSWLAGLIQPALMGEYWDIVGCLNWLKQYCRQIMARFDIVSFITDESVLIRYLIIMIDYPICLVFGYSHGGKITRSGNFRFIRCLNNTFANLRNCEYLFIKPENVLLIV